MRILLACATAMFALPAIAAELKLTSMEVDARVLAGEYYWVSIPYKLNGGVQVKEGCFTISNEEPRCFNPADVTDDAVVFKLKAGENATLTLTGHLIFVDRATDQIGQTNSVSADIVVGSISAPDNVSCVQQGLLNAGFDPNGVDGKIGNGTLSAAKDFASEIGLSVAPLTSETASAWCDAVTKNSVTISPGTFYANFGGGCGQLIVGRANADMSYRTGSCDGGAFSETDRTYIAQEVLLLGTVLHIDQATFTIDRAESSEAELHGMWKLGDFESALVFERQ